MRKLSLWALVACFCWSAASVAQQQGTVVDRTKYPDYTDAVNPDYSLMYYQGSEKSQSRTRAVSQRPDHVNNADTRYFPPVFNQQGGSCGSASRICYMFSYELAAYRDVDGSKAENYYPSHFVWLHTNSPGGITDQGKDAFVTKVGVPSAATYGGQTYSSLFGYQEESNNDFGWMQGYDKWFEAMHNRMLQPRNFPVNVGTEEGREAVKNWLWNHNGDESFQAGGICGIGVASGGVWLDIPKTDANDAIGVTGMSYVSQWGTQVDHALTIVGYDDRIEFDLDKDGVYGEADADELGAWIIVNSWGYWENGGFIYCPYAHGVPAFNGDGTIPDNFWTPEIYRVRKDYRPLRTIKLEMDYSRRSEIALSAGVSADLNATAPDKIVPFVHFTYAGDGNYGNSNPAPEVPMLGRWADGKLHTEPMEFGYDLTELTEGFDYNQPLKYFFIVDTKEWAQGNGTIHHASIMDYRYDEKGMEIPFAVGEGVEIQNAGNKTIISVVVYGNSYYAPQNAHYLNGALQWQAPMSSGNKVASYNIYGEGALKANVAANKYQYALNGDLLSEYSVSAVYADGNESEAVVIKMPVEAQNPNVGINFNVSGFSIPNVFGTKYEQATIEYWIKPHSLMNWNQSAGQWEKGFMLHANGDGSFTAGWDTSNRLYTSTKLTREQWNHVAIVVNNNKMTVYINGVSQGTVNSSTYSGIGGFGDLVFSANGAGNAQDAEYDEIRIWNTARSSAEIANYKNVEFTGLLFPEALLAYFKGDLLTTADGTAYLRDCVGENHAELLNASYSQTTTGPTLTAPAGGTLSVDINAVEGVVRVGMPVSLTAKYSETVKQLTWTIAGAGIESLSVESPTVVFTQAGTHSVTVVATAANGSTVTATRQMTVAAAPSPDATFTLAKERVAAGERVTFLVSNPVVGYSYAWSMPGAEVESATSINAAATYQKEGNYDVTLTVTAVDGSEVTCTKSIAIVEVAPKAAFSISPAVVMKGEKVHLRDESLYTPTVYQWRLENGSKTYIVNEQNAVVIVDQPGVYSVNLDVANGTGNSSLLRERALIVCNADSKNGLTFGYDAATVTAQAPFGASQSSFTIEWWMNAGWPVTFCNGIGDSEQTLLLKTNAEGKMRLYIGGDYVETSADYVVPSEWHHYAVTYDAGAVKFYRDGQQMSARSISNTSVAAMAAFRIGGENAPMDGSIDELRVWGKALAQDELRGVANAPIADVKQAEDNDNLLLYYSFNQSGGNVQDATSNANHGVRTGFGPEGDAWGLSNGVFCLNFGEDVTENVTEQYLKNYEKSFSYNNECVNSNLPTRTFAITDWTVRNSIIANGIITGAHVDKDKYSCMTVTTGWDGFAASLSDHMVYQTVTLPMGYYTFSVEYDATYEGQCGGSYVVASLGETLPVTADVNTALAYKAMKEKGIVGSNAVYFLLTEETTVSLGLLVNMSGDKCMTLQRFSLIRNDVEVLTPEKDVQADKIELANLLGELETLMEACGDYYVSEATMTAEKGGNGYYIWSNAPQVDSPVANLLDNNSNTFFHSNWQSEAAPADGLDHHLTVELGEEAVSLFKFRYQARSGAGLGDYPTTIKVQGSTDGTNYDDIATVEPRNANGGYLENGAIWTSEVIGNDEAYNYLRFMVTATTTNKKKDGHIFWHMAEFDLFPRSETPQMNTENTFVPAAFEVALQAVAAGEEAMELVQTPEEYEATLALVQAAYDELATAIASGKLPVRISLDADNPYVYRIGITRDYYAPANTVLQYDLANTGMVDVAGETNNNNLQAWYFTKGSADGQIYIHPYVGGGDVLSAKSIVEGHGMVNAAPKSAEGYQQEWTIVAVDAANGIYNIRPVAGNTYFSNHSGKGYKMGFYNSSSDPGSKFTFTRMEIAGEIWHNTLETYLDVCCTKENVADGDALGFYQGGTAYNDARSTAVEVLADMGSAASDYMNAYVALRSAKEKMIFHTPETGKFYRLKSKASDNYMNAYADNANIGVVSAEDVAVAGEIFYLTENNKLLSYKQGTYLKEAQLIGAIGEENGSTINFNPSESNNGGYFTLTTDFAAALYVCDGGIQVEGVSEYVANNCEWVVEEVTSLPVSVNGNIGFASFYAPVALTLPEGMTAYVVTGVEDGKAPIAVLAEAGEAIPANTGVLLEAVGGDYALTVADAAEANAVEGDNLLNGTIDDQYIEYGAYIHYMLAYKNEVAGLYRVAKNLTSTGEKDVENGTHFKNNGFKSYLSVEGANVAALRIYKETTDIEDVEIGNQKSEIIFDLMGRRVGSMLKGNIYIVNGKRVLVK